jgi:hypothetical protein
MKKILPSLLLSFLYFAIFSQPNYQTVYTQAREAHKAGDYTKFYELIQQAKTLHPYHPGILYHVARAAALNGKTVEATLFLSKAIHINADFDLDHPDFKSLQQNSDFKLLRELQSELKSKIINSDTAFLINDRTLHIECIATGEDVGIFYLGSIRKKKIIRVDKKGNTTNFTASGQNGLTSVFGIKTDLENGVLWACSSPMEEMENYDANSESGVFKFDLKTGKLLARYSPERKQSNIFGDLTLDKKGNAFVSDSKNNIVYTVNKKSGKLEEFYSSDVFWNIQGITFSHDGKFLFISDYIKGVFRLSVKTKELKPIHGKFPASMKGIDGLTFHENSLVAIQNAVTPMRVTQYFLDRKRELFTDYKIIDRGHPAFNEPTIGCISDGSFYYIANSLWSGYTDKKELKGFDQLQEVVVLKAKIE